jgi:hypothetical protein
LKLGVDTKLILWYHEETDRDIRCAANMELKHGDMTVKKRIGSATLVENLLQVRASSPSEVMRLIIPRRYLFAVKSAFDVNAQHENWESRLATISPTRLIVVGSGSAAFVKRLMRSNLFVVLIAKDISGDQPDSFLLTMNARNADED